nr:retrovirus-related Pol polyprotein from transposon TNT 1-94 [Tanacetum cinerariifolium]
MFVFTSQPSFKLVSTSQHVKQLLDMSNLVFSINWSGCGAKGLRLLLFIPFQPGMDGRRKNFAPTAILTKSGIVPISTARQSSSRAAAPVSAARPINTAASKPLVNVAKPRQNSLQATHSLSRRPFYQQTSLKNRNLNNNVNVAKGAPKDALKDQGYFDSRCSKHMTGNISYLTDCKEHDEGYVAFQGGAKGGKINGKGTIRTDQLGKFDGKSDKGIFVRYSTTSKAFRVYNIRTRKVKENLYSTFLENKPMIAGGGPEWLFDIDALSKSMNYTPVSAVNTTTPTYVGYPNDPLMPNLEDARIFDDAYDDRDEGAEADYNNLEIVILVSPIPSNRIHKDHPKEHIIGEVNSVEAMQEELLQFKLLNVWTLVDLPPRKRDIGTKWVYRNKRDQIGIVVKNKARLVAQAYASFMDFTVYQIDVESAFLYGTIEEEVYVSQPSGFVDPEFPDRVYKVEKALYGLHYALSDWYETLSTYLLDNGFRRGTIDKTLFNKKIKDYILLVQLYVDDIIFCSTKRSLSTEFEQLMHKRFQMSSIRELTFFLGLQVEQQKDGIFLSHDKYVSDILKNFDFSSVKSASTPMKTHKPLSKDAAGTDVDVHLYSSMIGSLMYLTFSKPDIMFDVCACSRFQVQPKVPVLIENLQQEKKIHVDSESAICVVKNPVYHSKNKHIEIRHHFIRDSYEKRLIEMVKIHTNYNVAELKGYLINDSYADLVQHADKKELAIPRQATTGKEFSNSLMAGSLPKTISVKFVDQHNMVAYLEKSDDNRDFHQIVDFLSSCSITYALTVSPTIYDSYIEQFWNTASSKTINSVKQIHAIVDDKAVVISESSVRSDLPFEDEDGITCLTNDEIFENLALMGYEPLSTKLTFQKDDAVHQEEGNRVERAITIDVQLETAQASDYIFKTQTTTMPNVDIPQEIDAGGSPRRQDTMGGTSAQTQSERMLEQPSKPPLPKGHTSGSGEGRLKLEELMVLCTTLANRVTTLENEFSTTKVVYHKAFITLTKRVKKLETHLKQKRSRVVIHFLDDEPSVDIKDSPKQGRMIEELDKDEDVNLVCENIRRSLAKDKGKGIMQETKLPKKLKKKEMIQLSIYEELAQKLYAEELAKEAASKIRKGTTWKKL